MLVKMNEEPYFLYSLSVHEFLDMLSSDCADLISIKFRIQLARRWKFLVV